MPACTRDGSGNPVISCATVESGRLTNASYQAIYDTTMYPTADPKEVKKRIPRRRRLGHHQHLSDGHGS